MCDLSRADADKTATLSRGLALLGLFLPGLACTGNSLPEPTHVSAHTWAWIDPCGPPAKENQGFRMNLGFVVGDKAVTVTVIDSGYGMRWRTRCWSKFGR